MLGTRTNVVVRTVEMFFATGVEAVDASHRRGRMEHSTGTVRLAEKLSHFPRPGGSIAARSEQCFGHDRDLFRHVEIVDDSIPMEILAVVSRIPQPAENFRVVLTLVVACIGDITQTRQGHALLVAPFVETLRDQCRELLGKRRLSRLGLGSQIHGP